MNILELIGGLEGAGLIITDMEEIETELKRMGVAADMFIPQEWNEEESDDEDLS